MLHQIITSHDRAAARAAPGSRARSLTLEASVHPLDLTGWTHHSAPAFTSAESAADIAPLDRFIAKHVEERLKVERL